LPPELFVDVVSSSDVSFFGRPATSLYPNGHFVKSLGEIGDLEAELKALLVHHNLDDKIGPFSQGKAEFEETPPPSLWFAKQV
jgi:exosome complex exonuclease DIS3/RRP44